MCISLVVAAFWPGEEEEGEISLAFTWLIWEERGGGGKGRKTCFQEGGRGGGGRPAFGRKSCCCCCCWQRRTQEDGKLFPPRVTSCQFHIFLHRGQFFVRIYPLHAPFLHIQLHNDNAPAGGGKCTYFMLFWPLLQRGGRGELFNEWKERGK